MATLTVENYAKAIYQLTVSTGGAAATGELARRLGVSPGTVTSMMRTLADSGLADYQAYEGVTLTDAGRRLALRVIRRHRLLELFLVKTLGLAWDEVHEEAEHLEHAVSERLVDRIDEFLQFPEHDPHGDPIPSSDGTVKPLSCGPLQQSEAGPAIVVRVIDQSPDFLRYLAQEAIEIGRIIIVEENNLQSDAMTVRVGERAVTISRSVAARVLVRPADRLAT